MTPYKDLALAPANPTERARRAPKTRAPELMNGALMPALSPALPVDLIANRAADEKRVRSSRHRKPGEVDEEQNQSNAQDVATALAAADALAGYGPPSSAADSSLAAIQLAQAAPAAVATDVAAGTTATAAATAPAALGGVGLPVLGAGAAAVGLAAGGGGGGGGSSPAPAPAPAARGQTHTLTEVPGTYEVMLNPARLEFSVRVS